MFANLAFCTGPISNSGRFIATVGAVPVIRRLPDVLVNRIAAAVKDMVGQSDAVARLQQMGVDPIGDTPAQFAETLKADLATWSEAARASNLKIE